MSASGGSWSESIDCHNKIHKHLSMENWTLDYQRNTQVVTICTEYHWIAKQCGRNCFPYSCLQPSKTHGTTLDTSRNSNAPSIRNRISLASRCVCKVIPEAYNFKVDVNPTAFTRIEKIRVAIKPEKEGALGKWEGRGRGPLTEKINQVFVLHGPRIQILLIVCKGFHCTKQF